MYQLIYLSSAVEPFSDAELKDLLTKARDNNSSHQLTGMLLYVEGNFIQILEGDKKNVTDLFDKVSLDPRHKRIIKIFEKNIDERNFPDWTMGFKPLTLAEAIQISGYKNVNNDFFKPDNFKNSEHPAIKLLKSFYNTNARR